MRDRKEPTLIDALKSDDHINWEDSLCGDVQILRCLQYRDEVGSPNDATTLHSQFLLKLKSGQSDQIQKFEGRLVLCGKDEALVA